MTILLYDNIELDERAARHLRVWKVWHVILFVLTAVFGILNYVFLQTTLTLVDGNCILYPRNLVFHIVEKPHHVNVIITERGIGNNTKSINDENHKHVDEFNKTSLNNLTSPEMNENLKDGINKTSKSEDTATDAIEKLDMRVNKTSKNDSEIPEEFEDDSRSFAKLSNTSNEEITVVVNNVTFLIENDTHWLMLDISRTFFGKQSDCQYAEYMPLVCTIFAIVWTTLFVMCPGGGFSRSGLQQPWRILSPALLFALVMVILTGHSFSLTNGGLRDFCSAFSNLTGTTACSSVDRFIERGSVWGLGRAAGATRAACAGAWATWACAAAALLARCLSAQDFVVRHTGVYLARDPCQKVTPHLRKTPRAGRRSAPSSPRKRDNVSIKSEPTATTELVTATVEHPQDSTSSSLSASPLKQDNREDLLELTHSPQELFGDRLNNV